MTTKGTIERITGRKLEVLAAGGNQFWSKPARDMAQILITFGGYGRKELIARLIAKVTIKNHLVQERHVLEVAQEMYNEQHPENAEEAEATVQRFLNRKAQK